MTIVARLRAAGVVFAEDEARLLRSEARTHHELEAMVQQRVDGRPLEQVVGWAEFGGCRITVEPGVFVPRRRTEFLVELAVGLVSPGDVVVDLGCGSGAIGVALAAAAGPIDLHAVDLDPAAVRCARRNLSAVAEVYEGDLFAPLSDDLRRRVGVVVANAPYVPTDEIEFMPGEARLHEPRTALDGGADGLDVQRRAIAAAPDWLAPGGYLLIETSERQAARTAELMTGAGLRPRIHRSPELSATVVVGQPDPT